MHANLVELVLTCSWPGYMYAHGCSYISLVCHSLIYHSYATHISLLLAYHFCRPAPQLRLCACCVPTDSWLTFSSTSPISSWRLG